MLNHHLHLEGGRAMEGPPHTEPSLEAEGLNGRLSPGQFLASLGHAIVSQHCRILQGGSQMIIRFRNGYGAIISRYNQPKGVYEIAPIRFHGPGPEDYAFHFRSHVPDLTWSTEHGEIAEVLGQISRLHPTGKGYSDCQKFSPI